MQIQLARFLSLPNVHHIQADSFGREASLRRSGRLSPSKSGLGIGCKRGHYAANGRRAKRSCDFSTRGNFNLMEHCCKEKRGVIHCRSQMGIKVAPHLCHATTTIATIELWSTIQTQEDFSRSNRFAWYAVVPKVRVAGSCLTGLDAADWRRQVTTRYFSS